LQGGKGSLGQNHKIKERIAVRPRGRRTSRSVFIGVTEGKRGMKGNFSLRDEIRTPNLWKIKGRGGDAQVSFNMVVGGGFLKENAGTARTNGHPRDSRWTSKEFQPGKVKEQGKQREET